MRPAVSDTVDTNTGDQGDVPGGRALTEAEWAALRSLRHRHGARWRDARHRALIPLFHPVRAILAQAGCRHGSVVRAVCWQLLGDLEQRGVTFAAWSAAAWQDTIARTEPLGRAYVTVVAYRLGELPGECALVTGGRVRLVAERLFGVAAVQAALDQARTVLDGWGYDPKPSACSYLDRVLCQALVLARSPHLATITPAHLTALRTLNRGRKRSCVVLLGRVLVALGLLPAEHARTPAPATPDTDAVGVPPEWYAWCRRWRAQSTQRDVRAMYGGLLQAGRWLAVAFPQVTTPAAWTQEIAVAFVAAVNAKRTGEWTRTWATNNRDRVGTPLRPASKAGLLSAVRTFFRDGQEWGWFPVRFNPDRCLRTPRAIRNLIGPDPRVIDRPVWAKLVAAGLEVTAEDLPARCGYPLAMIQALAALWVCTGLRSDELTRLRVGCIRWQTADVPLDDAGAVLRKDAVCFLDVPVNKTMTAFTKPVPPIVGQRIAAWERERPTGQGRFRDPTTGEAVDLLFAMRNRRLTRHYLNAVVVPLLCRKAGVPLSDARGRITSHRARASIASMLYNGPEPWTLAELQTFLGHKSPASTQYYARVDPTRLAKKYADTGYLERNLAMVEVLLDIEGLRQGTPEVLYYELGHGLCTNPYWHQCPHRMACVRCPLYVPGDLAQVVRAKDGIRRMFETVSLTDDERAVAEGDVTALELLVERNAGRNPPA